MSLQVFIEFFSPRKEKSSLQDFLRQETCFTKLRFTGVKSELSMLESTEFHKKQTLCFHSRFEQRN